jgi:DNA (cytosine-5)-methyltransferase 1
VIDAIRFVPQSRQRLFIVAVREDVSIPQGTSLKWPNPAWHPKSLMKAYAALPSHLKNNWIWWNLPEPNEPIRRMSELIEEQPHGVTWHTKEQTQKLLGMMSILNQHKLHEVQASGELTIGTVYKRTRPNSNGLKTQRAEVRMPLGASVLRVQLCPPTGKCSPLSL